MEDMLTSVNRYWLQNHSVHLGAGHVHERLYGCTSTGISRLGVDTSGGWSHSLHCALELVSSHCMLVFVFSCGGHDGFSYQFMGDYMDSFHSYFFP